MEQVFRTAVGVFIGTLAAIFAWEGIHLVALKVATEQAEKAMQKSLYESRRENEAAQKAFNERQEKGIAQKAQQAQAAQRAMAEAQAIERARRDDKEAAWKNFYEPSDSCKANSLQDHCANAHIRAKTEFEGQYRPSR